MATYLKFMQLESSPFEGPSSERLVLATESLRRAYTDIRSALEDDSPRICLSGGAGIGKSSLARALPKLLKQGVRSVLIKDPEGPWLRLRDSIVRQLELAGGLLSRETLVQARGDDSRLVLLIDQAEKIDSESLDHLDTILGYRGDGGEQLVQCVLIANLDGAPKGSDVPLMWWLDKLTTLQLRFSPIPAAGIRAYVDKHMKKAGWAGGKLFTDDAIVAIHRYTGGIPGAVSSLCEQLLTKAADQRMTMIEADLLPSLLENDGDAAPTRERTKAVPLGAATSPPPAAAATPQHEPAMTLEQGLYADTSEQMPSQGEATFSDARHETWTNSSSNRHPSVSSANSEKRGLGKPLAAIAAAAGLVLTFAYGPLDAKPLLDALPIDLDFLGLADDAPPKARRILRRQPPPAATTPKLELASSPASAAPTEPQLAASLEANGAETDHDVPPTMTLEELAQLAEQTDDAPPEFQPWTMERSEGRGPVALADADIAAVPLAAPQQRRTPPATRVLVAAPQPRALPRLTVAATRTSTRASTEAATVAATGTSTGAPPVAKTTAPAEPSTSAPAGTTTTVTAEPAVPASR